MKNEITNTEINAIRYPNHTLPEQPKVHIGKNGHILLFVADCGRSTAVGLSSSSGLSFP